MKNDVWKKYCDLFTSIDYQHSSFINAQNRTTLKIYHCVGSRSFQCLVAKMRHDDPEYFSLLNVYVATHTDVQNERVDHAARNNYKRIQVLHLTSEDSSLNKIDIFTQVLRTKSSALRGLGRSDKHVGSSLGASSLVVNNLERDLDAACQENDYMKSSQ